MTLLNRFYEQVVMPLTDREAYSGFARRMACFEGAETLTRAEVRELQWKRMERLLRHAWTTVPYYRRRMEEAGLTLSSIQSPADWNRLPILTREEIRAHFRDMISNIIPGSELLEAATGGTTDTPVRFMRDREAVRDKVAVQWRLNAWSGFRVGDRVLYLWGAQSDYAANPSWRWCLYDQRLMRRRWLPTGVLNEPILENYRQELNALKPTTIYAYPTPVTIFAEYLERCRSSFHRPRTVICTAEALTETQRHTLERVFECAVFEHYGSREMGMIAASCQARSRLHLHPLAAFVEYESIEGAGDGLKSIVMTDLINLGMPLIRYQINDLGQIPAEGECGCGNPLPLFPRVVGRTADLFRLPDGTVVPGVSLTNRVIQVCPAIRKMQIVQETPEAFTIRYVAGDDFSTGELETLRRRVASFFPCALQWTFEQVEEIPRDASGKTRFCISRVPLQASAGQRSYEPE